MIDRRPLNVKRAILLAQDWAFYRQLVEADQAFKKKARKIAKGFPIVCVGGSACGLDAYTRLLRHLPADIHRHGGIAAGTGAVEILSEPAVFLKSSGIARGLPDLRRAKMRAVGIRIADALNDGELARVVKFLETGQARMQSDIVVQFQNVPGGNVDAGAGLVIKIVRVWNHGVEAVIAAGQFDHHEDAVLGRRARGGLRPGGCPGERAGGPEREAAETGAQEIATRHAADVGEK